MNKHIQILNLTLRYDNKTEQLPITVKASKPTTII
jgi:hypothetical protein